MTRLIKFIASSALLTCGIAQAQAQSVPSLYLGASTGLENPTGLLGVHLEAPLTKNISVGSGVGVGAWGTKIAVEGKYYFKDCTRGWAVGAGIGYSTGTKDYSSDFPLGTAKNPVQLKLLPVTTAYGSLYRFWRLGKNHKFYLQTGYAAKLSNKSYDTKGSYALTNNEKDLMKRMTPGGFMFALGFSFRIAK